MSQEKEEYGRSPYYEEKWKEPLLYKVILHNDDYTSMDFVIKVLLEVYRKPFDEAKRLMFTVHHHGQAVIGTYTKEIAETKVSRTIQMARDAQFPLLCTFEPED